MSFSKEACLEIFILKRTRSHYNSLQVNNQITAGNLEDQSSPYKLSIMVQTLNELSQLKYYGYGQPLPRHGLNLLYWFAHDYIYFRNGQIASLYSPQDGDFGFHQYHNRIEDDDDHIVPLQDLPYYEVGNLNSPGANELPNYVRAEYNQNNRDRNKDRIIVRQDTNGNFNRVYVTEHSDPRRFDSSRTYRVSQGLLVIIKNMTREQYLKQTSHTQEDRARITLQSCNVNETAADNNSWCTILWAIKELLRLTCFHYIRDYYIHFIM